MRLTKSDVRHTLVCRDLSEAGPQRYQRQTEVCRTMGWNKAVASIRKLLARFRNSDAVIGELKMRAGKLNLGHVTGDAQAASDRTRFVGSAQLFFSFRNRRRFQARKRLVTGEAFGVVKCIFRGRILMWIVTGCAG